MDNIREGLGVRKERAVLVGVNLRRGGGREGDNLAELTALAESAGAVVVDRFQQKLSRVNPATYIGKGKAQMLWDRVEQFEADVVIFDNDYRRGRFVSLKRLSK